MIIFISREVGLVPSLLTFLVGLSLGATKVGKILLWSGLGGNIRYVLIMNGWLNVTRRRSGSKKRVPCIVQGIIH